jgi:hypothetical protein
MVGQPSNPVAKQQKSAPAEHLRPALPPSSSISGNRLPEMPITAKLRDSACRPLLVQAAGDAEVVA